MAGQVTMLDRHDGTSWMSRNREVVAHLRVAADEVDYVTVEAGGATTDATISVVPGSNDELLLHLGGSSILPGAAPGMVVKVCYSQNLSSFEFLTVVMERQEFGRLRVAMPRVVERRERRAASRVNVYEGKRVRLRTDWGGNLMVFDISSSGVGVVGSQNDVRRALHEGIRGVLQLTDDLRLNVWLDVRHTRRMASGSKMLMGARFLGLSSRDTAVIQNFIEARLDGE